jgi:hypothetical protein
MTSLTFYLLLGNYNHVQLSPPPEECVIRSQHNKLLWCIIFIVYILLHYITMHMHAQNI